MSKSVFGKKKVEYFGLIILGIRFQSKSKQNQGNKKVAQDQ